MMTESDDDPPEGVPLEVSHPHLGEFFDFLPELNKESDRGRVLISCSYLDELMRRILLAFVIDRDSSPRLFDGFNAPLGTFSTRTAAAYALGLITEREFNECETLRRIRNRFAHDVHASFDTQDIRDLCHNLTKAAQNYDAVVVDARGRYTTAAVALILSLTNRPAYVSRKRRQPEDWPD
jgi:mannitol operon repressor